MGFDQRLAMRVLVLLLLISFIFSCTTHNKTKQFQLPIELFGKEGKIVPDGKMTALHVVQPGDVLDVIYHFNLASGHAYRLAPYDQIEINFLAAPELNKTHVVRPDGMISLPEVGEINVSGKSITQLQSMLTDLYANILIDPQFTVNLTKYQAQLEEYKAALTHPSFGQGRLLNVRADNYVTFPLIGEINTEGLSIAQLREIANEKYQQLEPGMRADILLKKTAPHQVFVLGEVRQAGAYEIQRPISLMQAIALARGTGPTAELSSVVAIRREKDKMIAKVYNLEDGLEGKAAMAYLLPDDIVYVPKTKLARAADIARQISEVLIFRGTGVSFSYRLDEEENN
jgi:polysaccharide export outer membrane protein